MDLEEYLDSAKKEESSGTNTETGMEGEVYMSAMTKENMVIHADMKLYPLPSTTPKLFLQGGTVETEDGGNNWSEVIVTKFLMYS